MTATAYQRGHAIEYVDGAWRYADDGTPADVERPCVRCGHLPLHEGYDACLGYIERATSACCGHGVSEPIVKLNKGAE